MRQSLIRALNQKLMGTILAGQVVDELVEWLRQNDMKLWETCLLTQGSSGFTALADLLEEEGAA